MCYHLHVHDEFTCNHRQLRERQKVSKSCAGRGGGALVKSFPQIDCNARKCALSSSHKYDGDHDCESACNQRRAPSLPCVSHLRIFPGNRLGEDQMSVTKEGGRKC